MNSQETVSATKASLAQDWLNALRYWLRGRNGVIVLLVLAIVSGAALNWSWLVAVGIAPLLITVLPCAAMCALGLCMNKIAGGSCSPATRSVETPKPDARVVASLEAPEPGPVRSLADTSARPDDLTTGSAIHAGDPSSKPEEWS
jgi:hypothetical protein